MKKALTILGGIFICLIVVAVVGFSVLNYFGNKLDKESKSYVDEVIPIIIADWNSKELINRASPEFLESTPLDKLNSFMNACSKRLGKLKEYKGAKGQAGIHYGIGIKNKSTTAEYVAEAIFDNASATIQIQLVLRNDIWHILGFRVNSEVFMQ